LQGWGQGISWNVLEVLEVLRILTIFEALFVMFWNAGRLKSSRVALVTNDFPLEMFELLDGS